MYDIAAAYRSPIYKKCMVLMRRSEVAWAQSWVGKLAEDAPLFLLHRKRGGNSDVVLGQRSDSISANIPSLSVIQSAKR